MRDLGFDERGDLIDVNARDDEEAGQESDDDDEEDEESEDHEEQKMVNPVRADSTGCSQPTVHMPVLGQSQQNLKELSQQKNLNV